MRPKVAVKLSSLPTYVVEKRIALCKHSEDKSGYMLYKNELERRKKADVKRRAKGRKKADMKRQAEGSRGVVQRVKEFPSELERFKVRCDALEASAIQDRRNISKLKLLLELSTSTRLTEVVSCLDKLRKTPEMGVERDELIGAASSAKRALKDDWPSSLFGEVLGLFVVRT